MFNNNRTFLAWNISDPKEAKYVELLKVLGRGFKPLVLTKLILSYPTYFRNEEISSELQTQIDKYEKSYKKDTDNIEYHNINWLDTNNERAACKLLRLFKGGVKDFIKDMLTDAFRDYFRSDIDLSEFSSTASDRKKATIKKPKEVKVKETPVATPEPIAVLPDEVDIPDTVELSAEDLKMLDYLEGNGLKKKLADKFGISGSDQDFIEAIKELKLTGSEQSLYEYYQDKMNTPPAPDENEVVELRAEEEQPTDDNKPISSMWTDANGNPMNGFEDDID